jgi:hypothetical protein
MSDEKNEVVEVEEYKQLVSVIFHGKMSGTAHDLYREKEYNFWWYGKKLAPDDFVIVDSPSTGYTVVRVVTVVDYDNVAAGWKTKDWKTIVDYVDTEAHEAVLAKQARVKQLRADLQRRADEMQELVLYNHLAQHDESARKMLEELGELEGFDKLPTALPNNK